MQLIFGLFFLGVATLAMAATEFSTEPVKGNVQHDKSLFAEYRIASHGGHGEGGTSETFSRRDDLPIIAPVLNNAGFLAAASDDMIRHTLRHGREGTPMRSFVKKGALRAGHR